jgi:uncharacterized protein (DUF2132 family)
MDPLNGITLERILQYLVENIGWEAMYQEVKVNCFKFDASIKSSLTFLRKTPWAREKVEKSYIKTIKITKI